MDLCAEKITYATCRENDKKKHKLSQSIAETENSKLCTLPKNLEKRFYHSAALKMSM